MPTIIDGNWVKMLLIVRKLWAYLLFPNSERYTPDNTPIGIPNRLVSPIIINVPCIAWPMPPPEAVEVRNARLNCGAPLMTTSSSMLARGTMAITTQITHSIKKKWFLNFRKP
jgi:hypothetical protein